MRMRSYAIQSWPSCMLLSDRLVCRHVLFHSKLFDPLLKDFGRDPKFRLLTRGAIFGKLGIVTPPLVHQTQIVNREIFDTVRAHQAPLIDLKSTLLVKRPYE